MMRKAFVTLVAMLLLVGLPAMADHVSPSATVPETIPHPKLTAAKANGFYIGVRLQEPTSPDGFVPAWSAPYLFSTPYTSDTGWLPGDRVGYNCAYAFLQRNGEIVGRVTFQRLAGAKDYAQISDKFMNESERFYDGSLTPDPDAKGYSDCPPVQQSYEFADVPDERPNVVHWSAWTSASLSQGLEVRDYRTTTAREGVTFDLIEVIHEPFQVTAPTTGTQTVNSRVTVLAREAGVPFAVVYYDGIGTGQVSEELLTG